MSRPLRNCASTPILEANQTTMAGGFIKADDESVTTDDVTPLTSASSSPASFSMPPTLEDSLACLDLGHRLDDEATTTTANMVSNAGNGAVRISSNDDGGWRTMLPASKKAQRTLNPIRAIMDPIMATAQKSRDDGKSQISLALGDPTVYGNIPPCPAITSAILRALSSNENDQSSSSSLSSAGYANACGTLAARMAIAKHHHRGGGVSITASAAEYDEVGNNIVDIGVDGAAASTAAAAAAVVEVTSEDVIIANGVSGALELALTSLLDDDGVLLVPRPGFPLYKVITESHGASVMYYDLLPEHGWECDLVGLEYLLARYHNHFYDDNVEDNVEDKCNYDDDDDDAGRRSGRRLIRKTIRGILVNNPSNPTGAVYSFKHLSDILTLAARYQIPIIADEIYGDLTFHSRTFYPLANVAASLGYEVPIITASGLGKQYLVPGWRLGWIIYQDNKYGSISNVKKGAQRLAQVVLGACHLAQFAIPAVLDAKVDVDRISTATWKAQLHCTIEKQAGLLCGLLNMCHGLQVIFPEGAMYAIVHLDVDAYDETIVDDISFMRLLHLEENVVVLPGSAFGMSGGSNNDGRDYNYAFRVVFCAPENILIDAAGRISSFCIRHKRV